MKMNRLIGVTLCACLLLPAFSLAALVYEFDFSGYSPQEILGNKVVGGHDLQLSVENGSPLVIGNGQVDFDGSSSLLADINNDTDAWVVSCWLKFAAPQGDYAGIWSSDTSKTANSVQLDYRNVTVDKLRVAGNSSYNISPDSDNPTVDTWHHVAVLVAPNWGNKTQMWYDGGAAIKKSNNVGDLFQLVLGRNRNNDKSFVGQVAQIKIYDGTNWNDAAETAEWASPPIIHDPYIAYEMAAGPVDLNGRVGAQDGANALVDLAWKAGSDPNTTSGYAVNPLIKKHYLYMTDDQYADTPDPNLYFVGSVTHSSLIDPVAAYPTLTLTSNPSYDWVIDEVIDNRSEPAVGSLRTSNDPNIYYSFVQSFDTFLTSPEIVEPLPVDTAAAVGGDANFVCVISCLSEINEDHVNWYKDGSPLGSGAVSPDPENADIYIAVLDVTGVGLDDEGQYTCVVTNDGGSDNTDDNHAFLTVKRLMGYWDFDGDLTDKKTGLEDADSDTHDGIVEDPNFVIDGGVSGIAGDHAYELFKDGRAVVIADSNDYFNFFPRGLSVTVWAYSDTESVSAWNALLSKRNIDGDHTGYALWATRSNSDYSGVEVEGTGEDRGPGGQIDFPDDPANPYDNQWHMLTAQINADKQVEFYFDGALVATSTSFNSEIPTTPASLILGVSNDSYNGQFAGLIDEVKIYNYAKTPAEVAAMYQAVSGVNPCANLDGSYDSSYDIYNSTTGLNAADDYFVPDCKIDLGDLSELIDAWLDHGFYPAL